MNAKEAPSVREAAPVQVYLDPDDQDRLERLAAQLEVSKSDVLRRGLDALERAVTDPAMHPALRLIGLTDQGKKSGRLTRPDSTTRRSPTTRRSLGAAVAAELFVDTSAWYPAVVRNHPDHRRVAAALTRAVKQGKRVVTTNLVVAETHALLLRRVNAAVALAFARTVRLPPNLVVTSDPDLEAVALGDWLERFSDQEFSLTDAVSFAVMARAGHCGRAHAGSALCGGGVQDAAGRIAGG